MALIDKETICKELERRLKKISKSNAVFTQGKRDSYRSLLSFLDTLPEQPVTDCHELEKEIDKYLEPIEAWQIQEAPFTSMENIARHFYELGCTRTAVMYDDIEYNRQMAEEAEIANNLEEEIENYFDGWCNDDEYGDALMSDYTGVNVDNCKDIARFFAEWGAEHLKK